MVVELVPVSETDAEELATLRIAAMRDSLERIGRFDPQRARDRFLSGFSPAYTRHIIVNSIRVGFVAIKPIEQSLLLDHLYILPIHQGKGIGSRVLAQIFVLADAQKQEIRVGALTGSDSNRFYLRHGFSLVEKAEWDNYYVRLPVLDDSSHRSVMKS